MLLEGMDGGEEDPVLKLKTFAGLRRSLEAIVAASRTLMIRVISPFWRTLNGLTYEFWRAPGGHLVVERHERL